MFDSVAESKGRHLLLRHFSQAFEVGLVPHQQHISIWRALALNFGVPVFYSIVERSLVRDVVHDNQGMGS
jgi:hypothetical protein